MNRDDKALQQQLMTPDQPKDQNQLDLFSIVESANAADRYSNSIDIFDALPKFHWAKQRELTDLSSAEIVRSCTLNKQDYKIVIKPAILKKNNKHILVYPGQREEIVEEALRKIAVSGQAVFVDRNVSVVFTLYQLQQELKNMGHAFDINEIKESIEVCRGATLECFSDDGQTYISSSFFPLIGLTTRGDWSKKGRSAKCFVQFHPMVTASILNLTFRKYNYSLSMRINSPLARFIYKRMSHYWTGAAPTSPYTPHLVTFLSQSPRGLSERMSENIRAMKNALDVLVKNNVVSHYTESVVKEGRSVVDIHYCIYPHDEFVSMIISANAEKKGRMIQNLKATVSG